MQTILVVEDELALQNLLKTELIFEGYRVLVSGDGEDALNQFNQYQNQINLILLDWMIPKLDGLGVLRRIRRQEKTLPIIFLTARDFVSDKVAGLDGGADDYITKPFDMEELLARIRVIFRHQLANTTVNETYTVRELTLDTRSHSINAHGQHMQLTQREYALLLLLVQNLNEPLDRDEILDTVWGTDYVGQTNIVDVFIRQLRNKLQTLGVTDLIQTIRGVGYVIHQEA
jgi:DNA-binding response OmpR family regulator